MIFAFVSLVNLFILVYLFYFVCVLVCFCGVVHAPPQVPYWEHMQTIESKLDHVTAAVKAQAYVASDEPGVRGHLPLNGFTDKKIIKVEGGVVDLERYEGIDHFFDFFYVYGK